MSFAPLRSLGQAKSLADLKGIKSLHRNAQRSQVELAAKRDEALAAKARIDRLESTFLSSKGTSADKAKNDDGKVVLDQQNQGLRAAVCKLASISTLAAIAASSLLPERTLGVAHLDSDGKTKSLDAALVKDKFIVWPMGMGSTHQTEAEEFKMTVGDDGTKTYHFNSGTNKDIATKLTEDKSGRLTLFQEDEILLLNSR